MRENDSASLVGQRFGRLLVTSKAARPNRYICLCDCGSAKEISKGNLLSGNSKSCGCSRRERPGNTQHGGHGTLTYSRWKSMHQRCNATHGRTFKDYGGRGITVCERWHDFTQFLADMGECPDKTMTLDRIDNDIGYQPGNCRWASRADQNRNRTCIVMLTYNGETKSVSEWAAQFGMSQNALSMRLHLGWGVERALTQPLKARTINKP